jgi:hypothetical protein
LQFDGVTAKFGAVAAVMQAQRSPRRAAGVASAAFRVAVEAGDPVAAALAEPRRRRRRAGRAGDQPQRDWRQWRASLNQGLDYETRLFALLATGQNMREGTSVFLEKRTASFAGL